MRVKRASNRRKTRSRAFRLGHPLFINVSKPAAAILLCASTLAVILASRIAPISISYGPTFLLICAFAAWFIGNRFAVLLGLFIVTTQVLGGQLTDFRVAPLKDSVDLLFQLGSALAVVLMLGVARVALEIEWQFARIDPLTGALNRKAFFEAIEAETRQPSMAILIFADLDGLKGVNDTLGHEKGDEALRQFSERVRNAIRTEDVFARIGGDEFAVFLNVRNLATAKIVAERLDKVLNLDPQRKKGELTCSLGILVLPKGSKHIDAELRQADMLMYRAKRDRSGSVMAISRDDEVLNVTPLTSLTRSPGLQESSVRSIERNRPTGQCGHLAAKATPA